jgi:modulator of FtsH protease
MYQSRYQPRAAYGPQVSNAALLGQVLGITGVGFLITAVAAYLFRGSAGFGFFGFIVPLILIFVVQAVRNNPPLALAVFYVFTFSIGVMIAPVITAYATTLGPDVVVNAAGTTGVGMLVLGGIAFLGSFDWRRLSGVAFGLLVALFLVGIVSMFFHFLHPGTYAWLTLGVFTLLTLVDFSRIRAGGDGATPVQLAIAIYLDGINIFIALLSIFGGRRRD